MVSAQEGSEDLLENVCARSVQRAADNRPLLQVYEGNAGINDGFGIGKGAAYLFVQPSVFWIAEQKRAKFAVIDCQQSGISRVLWGRIALQRFQNGVQQFIGAASIMGFRRIIVGGKQAALILVAPAIGVVASLLLRAPFDEFFPKLFQKGGFTIPRIAAEKHDAVLAGQNVGQQILVQSGLNIRQLREFRIQSPVIRIANLAVAVQSLNVAYPFTPNALSLLFRWLKPVGNIGNAQGFLKCLRAVETLPRLWGYSAQQCRKYALVAGRVAPLCSAAVFAGASSFGEILS